MTIWHDTVVSSYCLILLLLSFGHHRNHFQMRKANYTLLSNLTWTFKIISLIYHFLFAVPFNFSILFDKRLKKIYILQPDFCTGLYEIHIVFSQMFDPSLVLFCHWLSQLFNNCEMCVLHFNVTLSRQITSLYQNTKQ